MLRSSSARVVIVATLLAASCGGCGPEEVANSPEIFDMGSLEDVGQLYNSVSGGGKKPPKSLKDLARNRDVFSVGYNAVETGDVVVYWGVIVTPGDAAGETNEVLAYNATVPTDGGPVLLKDLSIKTMTVQEFEAAPKPPGPTSSKAG